MCPEGHGSQNDDKSSRALVIWCFPLIKISYIT